jgi:hypothetical protein
VNDLRWVFKPYFQAFKTFSLKQKLNSTEYNNVKVKKEKINFPEMPHPKAITYTNFSQIEDENVQFKFSKILNFFFSNKSRHVFSISTTNFWGVGTFAVGN